MMEGKKWKIECVIYDCDGVLFDSLDANNRLYNHIALSMRRGELTGDELHFCHTHTVYESIAHIFRNDGRLQEQGLAFLKDRVDFKDYIVYLKIEEHLTEALSRLRSKGIRLAISTNRTTSMRHIMDRYNLWPYFDLVLTALHEVKPADSPPAGMMLQAKPKPDPETVRKILETLDIKQNATLYIGDSEIDMGTARSSGVRFIAYKNRGLEADGFIDDHLDLLDFLADG